MQWMGQGKQTHGGGRVLACLPGSLMSPSKIQFSSVQSLGRVWLFATPWTAARQASLSITNSQGPPKPMSIESVMPSSHLILCHPLLLLPSSFPSIRVFSNESALHIRWPKYWSFSFNISPTNEHPGLISLQSKGLPRVFSKIRLPLESDLDFGWAFGSLSSLTFPQLTPCWPNQVGLAWVQRNTE